MKFLGIIPARYASTRFPAKPLANLCGKTIIERVYRQVEKALDEVYVATDNELIEQEVLRFGGNVIMTSESHKSGTDRCYEAYTKIAGEYDVVINIQGDEPFIHISQIETIKKCFEDSDTQVATLVKPFDLESDIEEIKNPNIVKAVLSKNMKAMYFSRSVIPHIRSVEEKEWTKNNIFYKHIGLYAYKTDVLRSISNMQQTPLEIAESLEQVRWLENDITIKAGITNLETIGIDTPEDFAKAEEYIKKGLFDE